VVTQLIRPPRWFGRAMSLPAAVLLAVALAAGLPAAASGAIRKADSPAGRDRVQFGGAGLVSCPSVGDCVAAGSFGNEQGFLVDQVGGRWGEGHPLTARFVQGEQFAISSLSCPSAGGCEAGGSVGDDAFVVSQVRGSWGQPRQVAANLPGQLHEIASLSCWSPGNCTAGGSLGITNNTGAALLVSERNGRWGQGFAVPGLARLDIGQDSGVGFVSCPSAGNCAAAGIYANLAGGEPFLIFERGGHWGRAFSVAGNLHASSVFINSLSCAAAGDCVATGYYFPAPGHSRPFLLAERGGRRGNAFPVPGLALLNRGHDATVLSVTCASPGNCAAGGSYTDAAGHTQAFVVTEHSGRWGRALQPPGLAMLNAGGFAAVASISCPSPGDCVAVGSFMARYSATSFAERPFADDQRNGRWARVIEIRGLPPDGAAGLGAVSCASAADCAAAGGPIVDKVNGRWRTLFRVRIG
jgi:hypothetical protein